MRGPLTSTADGRRARQPRLLLAHTGGVGAPRPGRHRAVPRCHLDPGRGHRGARRRSGVVGRRREQTPTGAGQGEENGVFLFSSADTLWDQLRVLPLVLADAVLPFLGDDQGDEAEGARAVLDEMRRDGFPTSVAVPYFLRFGVDPDEAADWVRGDLFSEDADAVDIGAAAVYRWAELSVAGPTPPPAPDLLRDVVGALSVRRGAGLAALADTTARLLRVVPDLFDSAAVGRIVALLPALDRASAPVSPTDALLAPDLPSATMPTGPARAAPPSTSHGRSATGSQTATSTYPPPSRSGSRSPKTPRSRRPVGLGRRATREGSSAGASTIDSEVGRTSQPPSTQTAAPMLPLHLPLDLADMFGGGAAALTLHGPVTTFVGPNGSGKSQAMRKVKEALLRDVGDTLLLPAGRLRPLETNRLISDPNVTQPNHEGRTDITLSSYARPQWFKVESVQGIFDQLDKRKDIQIKVVERLRRLFHRELVLDWEEGYLKVQFSRGESAYSSAREASGLLHLVALLAALYHDGLKAVLIDEPEVSLHPQLQAFVLREALRVAGDPDEGKKLVVLATHAPAMVRLRTPADLPNLVFFRDADTPPVQIGPGAGVLKNQRLATFVRSLGGGHRAALFAARPLLVEGPSDEAVVDALDAAVGTNLHAAGSHILPVTGVGNVAPAVKLLRAVGKQPAALVDLDAFTDGLGIANVFNEDAEGRAEALRAGHGSLYDAVKGARDALVQTVDSQWETIRDLAERHPYWTDLESSADVPTRRRRAATAVLLQAENEAVVGWEDGATWSTVRTRVIAALDLLEQAGCFVLRAGTIEDAYSSPGGRADKLSAAFAEADAFISEPEPAEARHDVAVRALRYVARVQAIDESAAVAKAFVAVVAPALDELARDPTASTPTLTAVAAQHARESAALFGIERAGTDDDPAVLVTLQARVLDVEGFPILVRSTDNVNDVARRQICPST